jgi:hypothetical protein
MIQVIAQENGGWTANGRLCKDNEGGLNDIVDTVNRLLLENRRSYIPILLLAPKVQ